MSGHVIKATPTIHIEQLQLPPPHICYILAFKFITTHTYWIELDCALVVIYIRVAYKALV